jgi:hypothetical protein
LGVEDNSDSRFSLTYNGILENWEVVENKIEKIKGLMQK